MKDPIGDRMKNNYEKISQTRLVRRMPVIIRLDGKAFHTFTKGFKKPFDNRITESMQETLKYLCENVQNCVFGYTQSDEISLLLIDYKKFDTSAWFDNEVQKMVSIASSLATYKFNKEIQSDKPALFDARVFNIPKEEVNNYFLWRQKDAKRNSVNQYARSFYSQGQMNKVGVGYLKQALKEAGHPWEDLPRNLQQGSECYRLTDLNRSYWKVKAASDYSLDPTFIDEFLLPEEE